MGGDTEAVYAIAFEPNGKRLLSAGKDGIIAVRDPDSGQRMARPLRPEMTYGWDVLPAVLSLAISPDGSRIVSGNADGTVKIWSISNGALLHILAGHSDAVTSVAFSPDGRMIFSGSTDGTLRTWDWRQRSGSAHAAHPVRAHTGGGSFAGRQEDCRRRRAIQSSFGMPGTCSSYASWQPQLSAVNALAFARDSRRLAVGGSDTAIQMWDSDAGQLLRSLNGHSGSIRALAFSPDGRRLASGSDDKTVGIWQAN